MGSDMFMNPPAPDEKRIVHNHTQTAIYARHTDNIYREGTDTWFRKDLWDDPQGAIRDALHSVGGFPIKTVNIDTSLDETLPREFLEEKDRDWQTEEKVLMGAVEAAHREADRAATRLGEATAALNAFREEMKSHE